MEIWKKQNKISENLNKFAGSDSIILVLYTNRLCDLQIYSQCSNQVKPYGYLIICWNFTFHKLKPLILGSGKNMVSLQILTTKLICYGHFDMQRHSY